MSAPRLPVTPLFVPGDRPERFARAAASGADAVIIDLEDAVAAADKPAARANAARHGLETPVFVRINATSSEWFAEDLAALREAGLTGVVLPKAETAEMVASVTAAGLAVIALVETAQGVGNLSALLAAPGLLGVAFGSLDYAADLDCSPAWEPMLAARAEIVLRSRLAGLPAPIDGVTADVQNVALAEEEARRARAMGFGGKLLIHPRQVEPVRQAFAASEAERAWAAEVMAAVEADARGAILVAGALVDKPIIERARRILERA